MRKKLCTYQDISFLTFYLQRFICNVLFEVLNTGLKDLNILLSIDVDCNAIVATLAMCHLTENTSIRACDTLDIVC